MFNILQSFPFAVAYTIAYLGNFTITCWSVELFDNIVGIASSACVQEKQNGDAFTENHLHSETGKF